MPMDRRLAVLVKCYAIEHSNMRISDDDLDDVDLSVTHAILMLYDLGANRAQAKRALRERIEIMQDVLDEFEDATRPDSLPPYHPSNKLIH